MSSGGFAGGFAQGFSSTYSRKSGGDPYAKEKLNLMERRQTLAEKLGILRAEQMERSGAIQEKRFGLEERRIDIYEENSRRAAAQAESIRQHQLFMEKLGRDKQALEEKKADIDLVTKMNMFMDPKISPNVRKR